MQHSASDTHPARRPAQLLLALALLTIALAVAATPARAQQSGPGGPVLVITQGANGFSTYYPEILRAEGLNAFSVQSIATVTPATLNGFDVAILGETALTADQVTMLSSWVSAGGNLIAMRPAAGLGPLLGLTAGGAQRADAYLRVDTTKAPGAGIAGETMQYHGTADGWTLSGATSVATLFSDATTATASPAVTLRSVGANGGQAAAFAFDLARSIVQTRQGNPAWAGQERDGITPIRSDDLFFGIPPQLDWVNLAKVAVPQADEQQRLLANLITTVAADRKPLPRFWYLPRDEKAAVVMTGDDHGNGGSATVERFNSFTAASPAGCSVAAWECIRGTSYVYPGVITDAQASPFNTAGFEIGLHVNTGCADFTAGTLDNDFSTQLAQFQAAYPSLPAIVTNRTHCIPWSDWATHPKIEFDHGIRLDTNYYYFAPASWNVGGRPGFFTGSGFPMRFADSDGSTIDVYQAATQMTDESGQEYPSTVATLLDGATGANGYYGVFTANMHTDGGNTDSANSAAAIVNSAKARGVPVVSAKQMLTWLDGRNNSSFGSIAWSGNALSFTVNAAAGSNGLRGMVPATAAGGRALLSMTRNGSAIPTTRQRIKGVDYAFFDATSASYVATYEGQTVPPPPPPDSSGGSSTGGSTGSTGTPPTGTPGSNGTPGSSGSIGCLTLTSSTRRVRIGRRTVLTARVRRRGRGVARIQVKLTGPGLRTTTKRTNSAGNTRFTIRTRRKGTLRLRAFGQARSCKTPVVLVRAR